MSDCALKQSVTGFICNKLTVDYHDELRMKIDHAAQHYTGLTELLSHGSVAPVMSDPVAFIAAKHYCTLMRKSTNQM